MLQTPLEEMIFSISYSPMISNIDASVLDNVSSNDNDGPLISSVPLLA